MCSVKENATIRTNKELTQSFQVRILLFKRNLILKIDIKAEMLLLNQGGAAWSLTHSDPILSHTHPQQLL